MNAVPAERQVLILSQADNVGMALRDLPAGQPVLLRDREVVLAAPIPVGHKIALQPISQGSKIIKFGAPIGSALRNIAPGEHVHTHNIKSDYMPPFGRDGSSRLKQEH